MKLKSISLLLFFLLAGMMNPVQGSFHLVYKTSNVYIFGHHLLKGNRFHNYFYNFPHAEDVCGYRDDQNTLEWLSAFPAVKSKTDLEQVVYRVSLDTLQQIGLAVAGKGKNPLPENEFARLLVEKKDIATMDYLVFAKRCGPYFLFNSWEEAEAIESKNNPQLLEEALQRCEQKNLPPFLMQRYVFHAVRWLSRKTDDREYAIATCDKLLNKQLPKNYLYYRTLLNKITVLSSGEDYHPEYSAVSNIIAAQVFEHSPALQCLAYREFGILDYPLAGFGSARDQ